MQPGASNSNAAQNNDPLKAVTSAIKKMNNQKTVVNPV